MDNRTILQMVNCYLVKENEIVKDDLWVRNGKFIDPEKLFYEEKASSHLKFDCRGNLIAPGFIDLQINGKRVKNSFHSYHYSCVIQQFFLVMLK